VPILSWLEVEQDIWIAYFTSVGHVGREAVLRRRMVQIGLWGPVGQPGGRLGLAEDEEESWFLGPMVFEGTKTVPGHEDEERQQSVPPQTMSRSG
jgi:hypothetical protein